MDCLDFPDLELQILKSLAVNLSSDDENVRDDDIRALTAGVPVIGGSDDSELETWDQTSINAATSYSHYVRALPLASKRLPEAFDRIAGLLKEFKHGLRAEGPSGSVGKILHVSDIENVELGLLRAIAHIGASSPDASHRSVDLLCEYISAIQQGFSSGVEDDLAMAILALRNFHHFISTNPLIGLSIDSVTRLLEAIHAFASLTNAETLEASWYSSASGSPVSTSDRDGAIGLAASGTSQAVSQTQGVQSQKEIIKRFSKSQMVLDILAIEGILLSQALVGGNSIEAPLGTDDDHPWDHNIRPSLSKDRLFSLLTVRGVPNSTKVLFLGADDGGRGRAALDSITNKATEWWSNVMHGQGIGIGNGMAERRTRSGDSDVLENLVIEAILKILTLSCLHYKEVDDAHLARLKLLLSDKAPTQQAGILEMALSCTGVLVLNFPYLGPSLTQHIKRFATSPLPVFEAEMAGTGTDIPEVMAATARCLAICVKTSPSDDLVNSILYSLMHTVSHGTSMLDAPHAPAVTFAGLGEKEGTIHRGKMAEQTRMAGISTIGMVSKLALEIDKPETYQVTVTMLLQRLRGADAITEASIASHLVPLALRAPDSVLLECIKAFSAISRSANPEDPVYSSNAILAAQTRLAKGFNKKKAATGRIFLEELLSLFVDKGSQIQNQSVSRQSKEIEKDLARRVSGMTSELAALLLPIEAALGNPALAISQEPSQDLVASFRNMWLLSTLLGLTNSASAHMTETTTSSLARIAVKTPALVMEEEKDFVSSVLEYNSIFRREFAQAITTRQRQSLAALVPKLAQDVRNLSLPQLVFLQTVHDMESLRIQADRPSIHLDYFANSSLNDSVLARPLEIIADKLLRDFLSRLSASVLEHSMNGATISEEVRRMLIASTHRYRRVREVALKHLDAILTSFAALMCDRQIVFVLLEILTLLRRSCEDAYTDEYSPVYRYLSDKMELCLEITDDYSARNEMVKRLYDHARRWLDLAIGRAPIEMQTILQKYLKESRDTLLLDNVEMGAGLALRYAKAISRLDRQEVCMPNIGGWQPDSSNLLASQFAAKNYYSGELSGARFVLDNGLKNLEKLAPHYSSTDQLAAFRQQMADAVANAQTKAQVMPIPALRRLLLRAVSVLSASPTIDADILHYLVALPIRSFTALGIAAGVDAWTWLISERPDVEVALSSEISDGWLWTIKHKKGLFSNHLNSIGPFERPIEYSPTLKSVMDHEMAVAKRALQPHLLLTAVISSRFQAVKYRRPGIMGSMFRLLARSFQEHRHMSTHPLARETRFSLTLFALQVLASSKLETLLEVRFRDLIYLATLSWFAVRPMWSFGSNRIQVQAEIKLLGEVLSALQNDHVRGDYDITSLPGRNPAFAVSGYASLRDYALQHAERSRLLQLLVENEMSRLSIWSNPTASRSQAIFNGVEASVNAEQWPPLVRRAWRISPAAAVHMGERFKIPQVQTELSRLIRLHPRAVIEVPEALHYMLGDRLESSALPALKWLILWAPVPPVTAVTYFQPRYDNNPLVLQYAMRALEQYPVDLTFFFVPQVVQALRSDGAGYVERFIFETSKISQLFCHQIIWNMKANCYKDDAGEIPDPMKPQLERMVDMVVAALSGKARQFYDLEFNFFNEVTSISGKLKPYIKKSKPEKKAKIDEEMSKIKVSVGVYLPSNPDGVVVDLDRKSGRPLQSHAKAPFMATFKVRKEQAVLGDDGDENAEPKKTEYDVWQAAIFKVGDDCRQDVLALQIIAMFKNVFLKAGLVLYLFPYRVTATAPGCGVIDVVPNATSRDEMGRAKINDLYGYFIDKYGGIDTPSFQKARLNFIQSMAAYSVACYILQIKDRHNGNIMIDGEGHIVHIDFGFLFDIDESAQPFGRKNACLPFFHSIFLRPGGVKFEPNSFKLNHEMVALMGGRDSQGFRIFSELTVKAFLAIRPYADQLVDTVHLMLGTGLPSFKGEPTIKRLRDRFQLQLSEQGAADYMVGVIKNANENYRSVVYDEFQRLQNGIPY